MIKPTGRLYAPNCVLLLQRRFVLQKLPSSHHEYSKSSMLASSPSATVVCCGHKQHWRRNNSCFQRKVRSKLSALSDGMLMAHVEYATCLCSRDSQRCSAAKIRVPCPWPGPNSPSTSRSSAVRTSKAGCVSRTSQCSY